MSTSVKKYRDSATLKLAAEINDFVRSRTNDGTVGSIALQAAAMTFSVVPLPSLHAEDLELGHADRPETVQSSVAS